MRIAILGAGRMGREVERLAREAGHAVLLVVKGEVLRERRGRDPESLAAAEVVIDFSSPEAVPANVLQAAAAGKPLVEGTTGWQASFDEVRQIVEQHGTGLVYGANFSLGANVFFRLVEQAARFFNQFPDYDPYVLEHHHRGKLDAPSGTAWVLARKILAVMERKTEIQIGNAEGGIAPERLQVTSIRAGAAFGRHLVGFDASSDAIELVHTARSREAFARGALLAAEWIRERKGFFEFGEVLDSAPP